MKHFFEIIKEAEQKKIAIGHFNVATLEQMKAIAAVAKKLHTPIVVGVSEGEWGFVGLRQIVALRDAYRSEGVALYLNADHTRSLENVARVAAAGFDSVIFDAAHLSLEENIAQTKIAVAIVKKHSSFFRKIIIEGELGYIGTSSQLLDAIPEGAAVTQKFFTTPEDAKRFVRETGVHMVAPAVGNIHGMLKNMPNPHLDIPRIADIRKSAGVPVVLHGGSGISDEDFVAAVNAGISLIHISTELRVAWKRGIEDSLKEKPNEMAPYKILEKSLVNLEETIEKRVRLFSKNAL
jgi:fructose-bisphosphate aldolase class II